MRNCQVCHIINYRYSCAIADPITDTLVVTGGWNTLDTVTRYSQQGWLEDLPPLITGRYSHACSSFVSSGRLVSTQIFLINLFAC